MGEKITSISSDLNSDVLHVPSGVSRQSVCLLLELERVQCKPTRESAVVFQLKGTMIVGIDTYHDSSAKGRSCGGVVATTNKDFTRYYSTVTFHMSHQELQDNLKVSLNGGVSCWLTILFAL